MAMAKKGINDGVETDLDRGCALEIAYWAATANTEDRVEGTTAFLEKQASGGPATRYPSQVFT